MLARHEVAACLLVGSEGVEGLPPEAVERLNSIPTIALDHPSVESFIVPTVRFTTAVHGIQCAGTAYRMDEVPIPLRAVLPARYPTDGHVLRAIESRLGVQRLPRL
jgi:formylmethanofuran dehydrogenase subunit B